MHVLTLLLVLSLPLRSEDTALDATDTSAAALVDDGLEPENEPLAIEETNDVPTTPSTAAPSETDTPRSLVDGLFRSLDRNETTLVLAFAVSLLVWLLRNTPIASTWMAELPKNATPWIAVGLAVVGGVADATISGSPIAEAVVRGIVVGLCGAGSWSAGGKHLAASITRRIGSKTKPA